VEEMPLVAGNGIGTGAVGESEAQGPHQAYGDSGMLSLVVFMVVAAPVPVPGVSPPFLK
jgi:hypothetical protein